MTRTKSLLLCLLALGFALARAADQPATHKSFDCQACHTQASTQPATAMAHALQIPAANEVLTVHPSLIGQSGPYNYSVKQDSSGGQYSVTDGTSTITLPIRWAFGRHAQTWVLEYKGQLYESLMSYYSDADTLDRSPGDESIQPHTLEEAMGRRLANSESTLCFGCHATNAVAQHQLHLSALTPGVTCARCHSGTAAHTQAISTGKLTPLPQKLTGKPAEQISTFCGQCHRTWQTVVRNHWLGVMNVRFQPYRLANSKCYDGIDTRMSCTGCHNPHQELVRDAASYDKNCLSCHSSEAKVSPGYAASHPGQTNLHMPICKVAQQNCVSCHMPKTDLPGGHLVFSDHMIRIVKPGETYPN